MLMFLLVFPSQLTCTVLSYVLLVQVVQEVYRDHHNIDVLPVFPLTVDIYHGSDLHAIGFSGPGDLQRFAKVITLSMFLPVLLFTVDVHHGSELPTTGSDRPGGPGLVVPVAACRGHCSVLR